MPQADPTHTRFPSGVVAGLLMLPANDTAGARSVTMTASARPDEGSLLAACHAAMVRREAMDILTAAVADLHPADPRHEASYVTVSQLQPEWASRVDRVCTIRSQGYQGLAAKASLLASLVERDEDDVVQGGPALRMAASLADDLLVLGWS